MLFFCFLSPPPTRVPLSHILGPDFLLESLDLEEVREGRVNLK